MTRLAIAATALLALAAPAQAHRATAVDPEVNRAIAEAAAEFGVPEAKLRRVLACESGLKAGARNGQYLGLGQHGRAFVRHWYPRFNAAVEPDVLNNPLAPFDNARVTAWVVARSGWGQWPTCGRA